MSNSMVLQTKVCRYRDQKKRKGRLKGVNCPKDILTVFFLTLCLVGHATGQGMYLIRSVKITDYDSLKTEGRPKSHNLLKFRL